tara:strand:+ start:1124 stop:2005 length:882 start_codon:yes stop_codon:yes gene_type:complete
MILFQMHHMWYESNMIDECWHSILQALRSAPKVDVKIKICFNLQTYIEDPDSVNPKQLLEKWDNHPLMKDFSPEIVIKTDKDPFYNIADWRREVYDPEAKYTVWGESDTIIPRDFFAILDLVSIDKPHVITFAGRPMWDNSWDVVTHEKLLGYSKPCKCKDGHKEDCIELLKSPWKYKDYITQKELDKFNDESGDIKLQQVPHKIDGSLVCISNGHETPFIAPDMHFVREDTCFEYVCRKRNIPQISVTTRLKGHNYWHPNKRVGTGATRKDEVFKKYSSESQEAMTKFLQQL